MTEEEWKSRGNVRKKGSTTHSRLAERHGPSNTRPDEQDRDGSSRRRGGSAPPGRGVRRGRISRAHDVRRAPNDRPVEQNRSSEDQIKPARKVSNTGQHHKSARAITSNIPPQSNVGKLSSKDSLPGGNSSWSSFVQSADPVRTRMKVTSAASTQCEVAQAPSTMIENVGIDREHSSSPRTPNKWADLFKQSGPQVEIEMEIEAAISSNPISNLIDETVTHSFLESLRIVEDEACQNSLFSISVARGLRNPDTKCFMNAALQVLLSSPILVGAARRLSENTISDADSYPYWQRLIRLVLDVGISSGSRDKQEGGAHRVVSHSFSPHYWHETIQEFNPKSSRFLQEDAQEFLNFVLDKLHQEICTLPISEHEEVEVSDESAEWKEVQQARKRSVVVLNVLVLYQNADEFGRSLISRIFAGEVESIVFKRGLSSSSRREPFYCLQLDIQSDFVKSVSDAMVSLTAKVEVEGYKVEDKGSASTTTIQAVKQIVLSRLPPILILHFMRFAWTDSGLTKIHKLITYPLELKLKNNWLSSSLIGSGSRGKLYKLRAVVTHFGQTPFGGHYTADIYRPHQSEWYRYDDDQVVCGFRRLVRFAHRLESYRNQVC